MATATSVKNATINRRARDEAQESVNNLRAAINSGKLDAKTVRNHRQLIARLLRTYGHLGVQ